jgi:hypothetical protein
MKITRYWLTHLNGLASDQMVQELRALEALSCHVSPAEFLAHISVIERSVLAQQTAHATWQQARFFFFAGRLLEERDCLCAAEQYYALCERRISPEDAPALLALYVRWGPLAESLQHPFSALHRYQIIVDILQKHPNLAASVPDVSSVPSYHERIAACHACITTLFHPVAAEPAVDAITATASLIYI